MSTVKRELSCVALRREILRPLHVNRAATSWQQSQGTINDCKYGTSLYYLMLMLLLYRLLLCGKFLQEKKIKKQKVTSKKMKKQTSKKKKGGTQLQWRYSHSRTSVVSMQPAVVCCAVCLQL